MLPEVNQLPSGEHGMTVASVLDAPAEDVLPFGNHALVCLLVRFWTCSLLGIDLQLLAAPDRQGALVSFVIALRAS